MSINWSGSCISSDWFMAYVAWVVGGGLLVAVRKGGESRFLLILFAIVGVVITAAGGWMAVTLIRCGAHLPDARLLWGPLAWVWSDWCWLALGIGLVFSQIVYKFRRMLRARIFSAISWLAWAIVALEFRAFAPSPVAARWFVVGLLIGALTAIVRQNRPELAEPTDGPAVSLSL
jgi:hypothetical protein